MCSLLTNVSSPGNITAPTEEWTIGRALARAARHLEQADVSRPDFEAQYLLGAVLEINRAALFLSLDNKIKAREAQRFSAMVDRRMRGEPLQYIVGQVEFWSRTFHLTPDVLIPRHETEFVLEQAIGLLKGRFPCPETLQLVDMGVGSGVIADVLAGELGCHVVGVDISPAALAVAAANIRRHRLDSQVALVCSDLFAALSRLRKFDCIVANPPYVAKSEKGELADEVVRFEPEQALFGGDDGLDCYRRLIPESLTFLHPGGWLVLEIGAGQGQAITAMLQHAGYRDVIVKPDYSGRSRFACGRKE